LFGLAVAKCHRAPRSFVSGLRYGSLSPLSFSDWGLRLSPRPKQAAALRHSFPLRTRARALKDFQRTGTRSPRRCTKSQLERGLGGERNCSGERHAEAGENRQVGVERDALDTDRQRRHSVLVLQAAELRSTAAQPE
jgi:hypothetical protein